MYILCSNDCSQGTKTLSLDSLDRDLDRPILQLGRRMWAYVTRVIPGLSWLFLCSFCIFCFTHQPLGTDEDGDGDREASIWHVLLAVYTIWLHVMSTLFPARLVLSLGSVIANITQHAKYDDNKVKSDPLLAHPPQPDEKGVPALSPVFVIIVPSYEEDLSTLQDTLRVLAAHPQARFGYHVWLDLHLSQGRAKTITDLPSDGGEGGEVCWQGVSTDFDVPELLPPHELYCSSLRTSRRSAGQKQQ